MPQPGGCAPALEQSPWAKVQNNSGHRLIELAHGNFAASSGRVIDPTAAVAQKALEHHEMAEVPMQNDRGPEFGEFLRTKLQTLRFQTVGAGGTHDVAGFTPIAGNTTSHPQLFNCNPSSVVCKHNGQGCRAAFQGLKLDDGWRANCRMMRSGW